MGKQKREVWDYLMDIDYGVCLGPIDRINQAWVKDKRIFCGNYNERTDVKVNLPDLFGGDDGEGGPKGTVEIYPGTDDQMSSTALSSRFGLTPDSMPGYRGLCHMFFRGPKSNKGFRWTSMNPYLPSAKVSVTDIPWDLGIPYAEIPATVGVNPDGTFISAQAFDEGAPALNSRIPVARFDAAEFPDPDDKTRRIYLSDFGITNELLAETLEQNTSANWEAHMEMSWESAGSLTYTMELRVGKLGGSEEVYTLEHSGEDTGDTLIVPLPDDAEWFEARAKKDGSAFSDVVQVRILLATPPASMPITYPGYIGAPGSWAEQPGTVYNVNLGPDDYGFVSLGLRFYTDKVCTVKLEGIVRDAEGNRLNWLNDQPDGTQASAPAEMTTTVLWSRQLPPGAASFEVKGIITPFIPLFTSLSDIQTWGGMTLGRRIAGWCPVDSTGLDLLPDAGPAHILYECLTNAEWGLGESPLLVDTASFTAAAQTLYNEKFGLSMGFFQQADVETFCQEVLDHIKAALFQHPATGLWTLKLFRDDYDPETLDLWDETNCVATNRKRRAWGETTNQIIVTYTNPHDETEATVTSHDLANIQIQGGISSDSRNYYGVRNAFLAQALADRDVAEAAYPLFSATLMVDRGSWTVTPGEVRKFSWAEDSIAEMIVRVMSVDYGKPSDRKIKVNVVEDIFSVERTKYSGPQTSKWGGGADAPEPLSAEMALTLPLGVLVESGITVEQIDANPGSVQIGFLGDSDTQALLDIEAHTDVVAANGSTSTKAVASFAPISSDTLTSPLVAEASSVLPGELVAGLFSDDPEPGDILMLGSQEAGSELLMLDTYDAVADEWTVMRGIWDTVPLAWPVGSRLWLFASGGSASDPIERASGETVSYKLLPRNDQGRLAYSAAQEITITATNRPHQPFRPADTQLDGAGFDRVEYTDTATQPATVTATWATRNRTVEDSVAFRWGDAGTAGETGQTVTLRITDLLGNVSSEITGLTGESHDIPLASLAAVNVGYVEFWAVRDGIESWAAARREFSLGAGWGNAWGVGWGGPT